MEYIENIHRIQFWYIFKFRSFANSSWISVIKRVTLMSFSLAQILIYWKTFPERFRSFVMMLYIFSGCSPETLDFHIYRVKIKTKITKVVNYTLKALGIQLCELQKTNERNFFQRVTWCQKNCWYELLLVNMIFHIYTVLIQTTWQRWDVMAVPYFYGFNHKFLKFFRFDVDCRLSYNFRWVF